VTADDELGGITILVLQLHLKFRLYGFTNVNIRGELQSALGDDLVAVVDEGKTQVFRFDGVLAGRDANGDATRF
jgi:hypothetical protein